MSKPYPTDVLKKLSQAVITWDIIDPDLKIGSLSLAEYQAMLDRGQSIRGELRELEARLTDLRNQRDEVFSQSWKYIVRLRAAVKGIYGDDSSEYEMVGGTRRSERKRPSRRIPSPLNDAGG